MIKEEKGSKKIGSEKGSKKIGSEKGSKKIGSEKGSKKGIPILLHLFLRSFGAQASIARSPPNFTSSLTPETMNCELKRHKETLIVTLLGFLIMASLNVMMLQWQPEYFTSLRYGAWTAFWNYGEFSGFDTYTYIVISSFRPVYVLSRHPILAMMMWPLYELNEALKAEYGINCAIYIVAAMYARGRSCTAF